MLIKRFEDIISWQKSKDLEKISTEEFEELFSLSLEISKLISGLIKTL